MRKRDDQISENAEKHAEIICRECFIILDLADLLKSENSSHQRCPDSRGHSFKIATPSYSSWLEFVDRRNKCWDTCIGALLMFCSLAYTVHISIIFHKPPCSNDGNKVCENKSFTNCPLVNKMWLNVHKSFCIGQILSNNPPFLFKVLSFSLHHQFLA